MTPDLSTPEGRAELRALLASGIPLPWATRANLGFGDIYVVTKHPDMAPTKNEPCRDFVADLSPRNESTAHLIAAAVNALGPLLDALDASAERETALSREIIALRADLDSALISVSNAECRIDDLEATIERLTAPVTEEEGFDAAYHGDSLTGFDDASDMREIIDAFVARRKETTA